MFRFSTSPITAPSDTSSTPHSTLPYSTPPRRCGPLPRSPPIANTLSDTCSYTSPNTSSDTSSDTPYSTLLYTTLLYSTPSRRCDLPHRSPPIANTPSNTLLIHPLICTLTHPLTHCLEYTDDEVSSTNRHPLLAGRGSALKRLSSKRTGGDL